MKTDSLFYRLFQERPATVFELAGLAVPDDPAYRLHAEEIKQTAFRLDGVLLPAVGRADLPLVFTEAQFYHDPWFYARWLASIFLYLYRHRIVGHWQAVVVFPDRSIDAGATAAYEVLLRGGVLHRIYLTDLLKVPVLGLGPRLARLVVMDEGTLVEEARALVEERGTAGSRDMIIDLIETILVYKFPKLSREEIQIMLHLPETDLKQTRFYQEVFREGEAVGEKRGEKRGELSLVLRQLNRRLGGLTSEQQRQVEALGSNALGALGEALLDFSSVADLEVWLQRK